MAEHTATVSWQRGDQPFADGRYSRAHVWRFDGGAVVAASSSPHVVPQPYSDPTAIDPEEAFIAAISSCHMLWFLSIAARRGFVVESYTDHATATLAANAAGKQAITEVTLHPVAAFGGERRPSAADIAGMHHDAHEECFIANSVTCRITCVPG
ncbi:MAG: OsmC family protein [Bacteroidales bacterium]